MMQQERRRRAARLDPMRAYGTAPGSDGSQPAGDGSSGGSGARRGAGAAEAAGDAFSARSLVHHAARAGPGLEDAVSDASAGFVPRSFISSRSKRAAPVAAAAADFMDEAERAALAKGAGKPLRCSPQYDSHSSPLGNGASGGAVASLGKVVRAEDSFAGMVTQAVVESVAAGSTERGKARHGSTEVERKGLQLLRTLGWREGGGIGARAVKVRGAAAGEPGATKVVLLTGGEEVDVYAPQVRPRLSRRGVGYGGAGGRLDTGPARSTPNQSLLENSQRPKLLSDVIAARQETAGAMYTHEGPGAYVMDDADGDGDDIYDDGPQREGGGSRLFTSTLRDRGALGGARALSRDAAMHEQREKREKQRLGMSMAHARSEHDSTLSLFAARPKEAPKVAESVELVAAHQVGHMRVAALADVLDETTLDVPAEFDGVHVFENVAAATGGVGPAPPPAPPPRNAEVRRAADTLAAFVVKNGPDFEEIARDRNAGNRAFVFLFGGEGAAYYAFKKHELGAKLREDEARTAALAATAAAAASGLGAQASAYPEAATTLREREAIMRDDAELRRPAPPYVAGAGQTGAVAGVPAPPSVAGAGFNMGDRFAPAGAAVEATAPGPATGRKVCARHRAGRAATSRPMYVRPVVHSSWRVFASPN